MTLSNWIKETNYNLRGTDDDSPSLGDDEWVMWVTFLNKFKDDMYDDVDKNWQSAYDDRQIGAIIAATSPSFNLTGTVDAKDLSQFIAPEKQAYVIDLQGNYHYFDIRKAFEVSRNKQEVYISGQNPRKVRFSAAILANDAIVGGTLYLPGYWRPNDIDPEGEEDPDTITISVDDPHWLSMRVAAAVAEGDITYEDKFPDLLGQANTMYKKMGRRNRRGTSTTPRQGRTITPYKIGGFR